MISRWSAVGLALLLCALPAQAAGGGVKTNQESGAAAPAPPYRPLPIPIPPGAKVSMELDAHHDDLLGVIKSMLRGFDFNRMMQQMGPLLGGLGGGFGAGHGPGEAGMPGEAAEAPSLTDSLGEMLRGINQLHVVVFKPADANVDALMNFYQEPFLAEGGRRALWMDEAGQKLLIIAFPKPHGGFAAIMPQGEQVMVMRADGFPDLQNAGSLMALFAFGMMARGMPDMTGVEAMPEPVPVPTKPAPRATPRATPRKPSGRATSRRSTTRRSGTRRSTTRRTRRAPTRR